MASVLEMSVQFLRLAGTLVPSREKHAVSRVRAWAAPCGQGATTGSWTLSLSPVCKAAFLRHSSVHADCPLVTYGGDTVTSTSRAYVRPLLTVARPARGESPFARRPWAGAAFALPAPSRGPGSALRLGPGQTARVGHGHFPGESLVGRFWFWFEFRILAPSKELWLKRQKDVLQLVPAGHTAADAPEPGTGASGVTMLVSAAGQGDPRGYGRRLLIAPFCLCTIQATGPPKLCDPGGGRGAGQAGVRPW